MSEVQTSWNEVADRVGTLALKLKLHAEQAVTDEQTRVHDALTALGDAITHSFSIFGAVSKDVAVRQDAQAVGDAMRSAVEVSFAAAGSLIAREHASSL